MKTLKARIKLPAFISLILILVLGMTTLVLADGLIGDADAFVLEPPSGNSTNATQPAGTTEKYSFSAYISQNNKTTDDVFPSGGTDYLYVTILGSGEWKKSLSANTWKFNSYGTPQVGYVEISVPCGTQGTTKDVVVTLTAGASTNGKTLNPDHIILTYTITAGANDPSCTPVDKTKPVVTVPGNMTVEATSPAGAVVTFAVSALDNVDGPITPTCSTASGATFGFGATTVTCSATDKAGNTGTGSFTVTVQDTTKPDLTVPANITAEATGPSGAAVSFSATANDTVDGNVPVSCTLGSGSTFAIGTTTITCTATDSHNNTATGSFTVTVQDTTPPALTVPANTTAEATGPTGAAVTFTTPTAIDLVDGNLTPSCSAASGDTFALGSTTVTCSASDAHNNKASSSFTITVVDTTPPALTLPADITKEATGPSGAVVTFTAAASDLVDGSVAVTCTPASGSTFALGDNTVTCAATDTHSNTAKGSFIVRVVDTTPPALTLPADITKEAMGPNGAAVSFSAIANDIVDGSVTPDCSPASGSIFALGTTTVNCTATDKAGNEGFASFTVIVQDTTPPTLSLPTVSPVEATGPSGAVVTFTASATDLVDGAVNVTCTPISGSTFALGTTSVNCSASDAHNNTAHGTFPVTVRDTTPPALTVPANITAEATGPSGAAVPFTASANDIVDGSVTPVCTPASGSIYALGTTTVTCTASDAHSNTATGSFAITVRDTTPPALVLPTLLPVEATGPNGAAVTFTVTATDIVDGPVVPVCVPASGDTFALGNTTVSCYATDKAGNTANGTFIINTVDTTPPALTLPADITAEATGINGATVSFSATATDIVDGPVNPVCSPASGSTFALGASTVTCTASDTHGNKAKKSFTVTVQDTTPPALTLPANITAEATGPSGAAVSFTASANDIVDGSVTPSCSVASGSTFALGTTTVTCSAGDAHGNTGSGTFTVNVQDTTPPALTLPANITADATGPGGAAVSFTASATDLVDGAVNVTCTPASGSTFALGSTTVNCSATDTHGNSVSGSFTVTVHYQQAGLCYGSIPHSILQPINADGLSVFKQGSTVPAKFRVCYANGTPVSDPNLVTSFKLLSVGTTPTTSVNETVASTTPDNAFRWSATDQLWIYNISTKNLSTKTYTYRITLNDGSTIDFTFGLK